MKLLMSKLYRTLLFVLFAIFSLTAWAEDAAADPQVVLKQVTDEMISSLQKDQTRVKTDDQYLYQLVDKILIPHVDFEEMSKKVLATYWNKATPEQRQKFQNEFSQMVVRTYATAFRSYTNQQVIFVDERYSPSDPNRVEIKSVIRQSGTADIPVNYRLLKENSGQWKVYDLNVDGISLVSNFRDQFTPSIRRQGLDAVINEIAVRNQQQEKSKIPGSH